MKKIALRLKKFDWWLILFTFLLIFLGLLSLYSTSLSFGNFSNFQKQLIFAGIGFLLLIFISLVDIEAIKESSLFLFILYLISLLLLSGLFLFGQEIREARRWYAFFNFTFEPVEIVKIVLILLFAKYFSERHVEMYQPRHIFLSALYVFLPTILVFFQPSFGSAMIFIILWLGMMLISGIKRKHLFSILVIGMLGFLVLWNFFLAPYQKERFIAFLNPYLDPTGSGYHIIQSIIAIGSGGLFGKGIGGGTQVGLGFLPETQTDFIFAAIAEEFGLFSVFILLLLFSLFIWRVIRVGYLAKNNFSRLISGGFGLLIATQVFINIGMNLGILPITGVPLPFLSYGGSSLLAMMIGVGIIESIKASQVS